MEINNSARRAKTITTAVTGLLSLGWLAVGTINPAQADPPRHAPAWGYRAKQDRHDDKRWHKDDHKNDRRDNNRWGSYNRNDRRDRDDWRKRNNDRDRYRNSSRDRDHDGIPNWRDPNPVRYNRTHR